MEWKLILQTGGKGISREGQEFGGAARFSVICLFFLSIHCFLPLPPSFRFKGAPGVSHTCVWSLAFSGSAFGIVSALGLFRAGQWLRTSWGFRFRFRFWLILARVGPHRSINTA